VPIAFRGGSTGKKRVHIYWQRRIRQGDTTTPWWFPAKTDNGAMREDRLVLPIPPGKHWSDAMPVIEPEAPRAVGDVEGQRRGPRQRKTTNVVAPKPAMNVISEGGMRFGPASPPSPLPPEAKPGKTRQPTRERKPKVKSDPLLVAAARELRDRYLERMNDDSLALPAGNLAKYDVSRGLRGHVEEKALPLLVGAA